MEVVPHIRIEIDEDLGKRVHFVENKVEELSIMVKGLEDDLGQVKKFSNRLKVAVESIGRYKATTCKWNVNGVCKAFSISPELAKVINENGGEVYEDEGKLRFKPESFPEFCFACWLYSKKSS